MVPSFYTKFLVVLNMTKSNISEWVSNSEKFESNLKLAIQSFPSLIQSLNFYFTIKLTVILSFLKRERDRTVNVFPYSFLTVFIQIFNERYRPWNGHEMIRNDERDDTFIVLVWSTVRKVCKITFTLQKAKESQ